MTINDETSCPFTHLMIQGAYIELFDCSTESTTLVINNSCHSLEPLKVMEFSLVAIIFLVSCSLFSTFTLSEGQRIHTECDMF